MAWYDPRTWTWGKIKETTTPTSGAGSMVFKESEKSSADKAISSIVGVWFNASGNNPFPLLMGGVLMMIAGIKLTNLLTGADNNNGRFY